MIDLMKIVKIKSMIWVNHTICYFDFSQIIFDLICILWISARLMFIVRMVSHVLKQAKMQSATMGSV